MWSNEAHKPAPDGFAGVEPVVTIDRKEMTVAWGDTKLGVGAEKIWKLLWFMLHPIRRVALRWTLIFPVLR